MNNDSTELARRPSLALLASEPWRAGLEFVAHKFAGDRPSTAGDGHPIVIFPGLASDGTAVAPLRKYCAALGYTAYDWGQGFNVGPRGDVDRWLANLASSVIRMIADHKQPATLIGWSLGGLYARELAKIIAPRVRQVITIGTPFNADRDHTNVGWLFRLVNRSHTLAPDPVLSARLSAAPPVPTTSIYSRSDGVVAWRTCLHQQPRADVEDIEVTGSHIGLGWNPAALRIIADRLAQRSGQWKPYRLAGVSGN